MDYDGGKRCRSVGLVPYATTALFLVAHEQAEQAEHPPYREIHAGTGGPPPLLPFWGGGVRHRPVLQQPGGVVSGAPGRGTAAQGPAVLSPVRRERRDRVCRLRVGAEPAARHVGRADPSSARRRGV